LDEARQHLPVTIVSLGDYVLGGGEVAVLVMVEAIVRLVPGVVGNAASLVEESHEDGLLEYPLFTKPPQWRGRGIPEVLLSGHHGEIARWRRDERLRRTAQIRPDMIARLDPADLDERDREVLAQFQPAAPAVAD
jgi:tRNA (guanine37-N1)-methyltransferase